MLEFCSYITKFTVARGKVVVQSEHGKTLNTEAKVYWHLADRLAVWVSSLKSKLIDLNQPEHPKYSR